MKKKWIIVVAVLLVLAGIGSLSNKKEPAEVRTVAMEPVAATATPKPTVTPKPAADPTPTPELIALAPASEAPDAVPVTRSAERTYIINTSSGKFHVPSCSSVSEMKESNKREFSGSRDDLIASGYQPCGRCHP